MSSDKPQQVIKDIRHDYGIREDGTQDAAFKRISRNLKNSIEQLSTGLYEKEVHFILELIQNAEDNKYQNKLPDLRFVVLDEDPTNTPGSDGCFCVFNNEAGFEKKHVESICQIGESSKTDEKKKQGYIGEKGIGFKSVFIVSSMPHIYSNGYYFQFKENDLDIELSYIVPYWLDSIPNIVKKDRANTAILLPLKADKKAEIITELKRIKPETILFLSTLEGLSVDIRSESTEIDLVRDKTNTPVIDLLIQQKNKETIINRYWLYTDTVAVPKDIKEEKRKKITDRRLTIAFPLDEDNKTGTIYAYLPTEVVSGLPFLINADFILTANRESIQVGRAWNLWLRDELAGLIVDGLVAISSSIEYRKTLYGFIPLDSDINTLKDYFKPVCQAVHNRLSSLDIVLVDTGELVRPTQARLASKEVRKLFGGDSRPLAFNEFTFVDASLEKHEKRIYTIGVRRFHAVDLKNCLSDVNWLLTKNSKWFLNLYNYLRVATKGLNRDLQKLPIIPVQIANRLCSCASQVYFPVNKNVIKKLRASMNIENSPEIAFLDDSLFKLLSDDEELLAWVKKNLKIVEFSFSAYVSGTLVPWLYTHADELKENDLLTSVQLMLNYWDDINTEDRDVITKKMPVLLDDGTVVRIDRLEGSELLTPRNLDKDKGWQLILKSEDDYWNKDILSDNYLKTLDVDTSTIEGFFEQIKATVYPDLRLYNINKYRYRSEFYRDYAEAIFNDFNHESTETPTISTWITPSFFHDETLRNKKKNRVALVNWLEGMLPTRQTTLQNGTIRWFYYSAKTRSVISGLYYYLTTKPWISTTKGLKCPGEIFVKNKHISEMFGNRLAYLKDDISSGLCDFLGIKTEVTTDTVLEFLRELSKRMDVDLKLIKQLYKYLDDYGEDYAQYFHDESLIYIPDTSKHWFSSSEVIWEDTSQVLGKLYGWLSSVYESSNLKGFFTNELNISESVMDEDLANAWLQMPERTDLKPDDIEASLTKIYPRLLIEAKSLGGHPAWWVSFISHAMVWTQNDEFMESDEVYVPDDYYLRNLFSEDLSFAWKPTSHPHNALLPLYKNLEIPLLSESIDVTLDNTGEANNLELSIYLTDNSKLLLCYMIYNDSPEKYEELFNSSILKELLQSVEAETDSLSIRYDVTESWHHKTVNDKNAFLDVSHHLLYHCKNVDRDDLLDDIAEVISRAIWGAGYKKHEDHVRITLAISSEDRFKKLRDKKGWNLPPDIRKEVIKLIGKSGCLDHESDVEGETEEETQANATMEGEKGSACDGPGATERKSAQTGGNAAGHGTASAQREQSESQSGGRGSRGSSGSGASGQSSRTGQQGRGNQHSGRNIRAGKSKSQGIASSANNARRNLMRSYVANNLANELDSDNEKRSHEARQELGKQGELEVVDDLRAKGFEVKRMPPNNKGYDIEAVNPITGEMVYIEVKGDSFDWSDKGVGITPSQYRFGLEKRSSFYLAVVENLRSSPRHIYYIQDPVSQITQYRFDSGWAGISTLIDSVSSDDFLENETVPDRLIKLTESKECGALIKYCDEHGYPFPDVGTELIDDDGAVIFENIELSWEQEKIGVLLSDEERNDASNIDDQWLFYSVDEVDDITKKLDTIFNTDKKCES